MHFRKKGRVDQKAFTSRLSWSTRPFEKGDRELSRKGAPHGRSKEAKCRIKTWTWNIAWKRSHKVSSRLRQKWGKEPSALFLANPVPTEGHGSEDQFDLHCQDEVEEQIADDMGKAIGELSWHVEAAIASDKKEEKKHWQAWAEEALEKGASQAHRIAKNLQPWVPVWWKSEASGQQALQTH